MSTPTITQCPKFAWCVQGHDHKGHCSSYPYILGSYEVEQPGVAAPLEPSRLSAEDFYTKSDSAEPWNDTLSYTLSGKERDDAFLFAEAYAAAVSKNLQRYKNAINNHLCKYDAADWVACSGCHFGEDGKIYCVVCEEAGDHPHTELGNLKNALGELIQGITAFASISEFDRENVIVLLGKAANAQSLMRKYESPSNH